MLPSVSTGQPNKTPSREQTGSSMGGWEDEVAHHASISDQRGLAAKCVPLAARQSSTRVEAQGVLVAAAHPGPQHVATDKMGAVLKWNNLLQMVADNRIAQFIRRKPWGATHGWRCVGSCCFVGTEQRTAQY